MDMDGLILFLDTYFIRLYRVTGSPLGDYFIGTFLLALISVAVGEASVIILRKVNKSHMEKLDREMSEKHSLSLEAKKCGDKAAYQELNKEANDAFGKVFFNMFTLSAASLWFVFVALAWMQLRFIGIEFPILIKLPLLGETVGYVFTFFMFYVLARILARNIKGMLASERMMPEAFRILYRRFSIMA
jgi:hypothetical protein